MDSSASVPWTRMSPEKRWTGWSWSFIQREQMEGSMHYFIFDFFNSVQFFFLFLNFFINLSCCIISSDIFFYCCVVFHYMDAHNLLMSPRVVPSLWLFWIKLFRTLSRCIFSPSFLTHSCPIAESCGQCIFTEKKTKQNCQHLFQSGSACHIPPSHVGNLHTLHVLTILAGVSWCFICAFPLHFRFDKWSWTSFHVIVGLPFILFCEVILILFF